MYVSRYATNTILDFPIGLSDINITNGNNNFT